MNEGRGPTTMSRRAEGRRVGGRCASIVAGALLASCTTGLGTLARVQAPPESQGYKMLRPAQTVVECAGDGIAVSAPRDLLDAAIRRLLARDDEADSVVNARVESTRWSLGVYGRRCVTVTGDVVRSTSTILLPMPGEHQGHGAHGGHPGH
jgi:hypothetical protein